VTDQSDKVCDVQWEESIERLARLTIVIPTFGRPEFLSRQVEYWGDSPAKVLVLDGSEIPNQETDLPGNFTYVHSREGFISRLIYATTVVDTEFVALLADDEFFLKEGLVDAIRQMDSDQGIIGCVGRCLYFFVDQGNFLLSHAYRDWRPFPSSENTLCRRLDSDLPPNKTHMAMYGVYRQEKWVTMVRNSYSVPFSCGYVYERLMNLQRSVLGRTEILESLLWMRSKENPPQMHTEIARTNGNDFVSWATAPEFVSETMRYQGIAMGILKSAGVDEVDATRYVDRFFNGGILRQSTKEQSSKRSIRRKLGYALLKYPPKRLRLFCKRHLPARYLKFTGWEGYPLPEVISDLNDLGTRFNERELWHIAELSLAFDKRRRSRNLS
jgi:glycosyltransferase domain-containing protein